MNRAVYAGSFDPLTNGHLWMIEKGATLFDELVVAIGVNPEKRSMFTVEERRLMILESTRSFLNIDVTEYTNKFLVNYARSIGARFILRGIRNHADFIAEQGMRNINNDLASGITTVFLMPDRELCEVSSSIVKGSVGPEGWEDVVRRYVPEPVFDKLKERSTK